MKHKTICNLPSLLRIFLCFLLSCISCNIIYAQDEDATINAYAMTHSTEKVYLHLDNNNYTIGDTIWFKGYVLNNLLPSKFSANLYVDWYDENSGKLIILFIFIN